MDENPEELRKEYVAAIVARIEQCNDIELLDFILQMINKNIIDK